MSRLRHLLWTWATAIRHRALSLWLPNGHEAERQRVEYEAAEAARQREDVRKRLQILETKVRVMGRQTGEAA